MPCVTPPSPWRLSPLRGGLLKVACIIGRGERTLVSSLHGPFVVSVLYSLATQRDPLCGPTVKLFNRPAPCADFGNCHCHHHRQCRCSHPLNCHRLSLSLSLSLFPLRSAWRWVIRCGAADCRSFGPCAWHRDSHVVGRCM